MNVFSAPRLVLLAALGACSFVASAQSTVGVAVEAGVAAPGDAVNAGDRPATHPFCLKSTGSNIPLRARTAKGASDRPACVERSGRVYTREDLQTTGAVDLADALRRLDPSIR